MIDIKRIHCGKFEIRTASVRRVARVSLLFAIPAVLASGADASTNGYTQIPIAKVFGDGVAAFSVAASRLGTSSTFFTSQYGLLNKCDIGLDYQSAPGYESQFIGNVKYLIVHDPGRFPDMAVGFQNVASEQRAVPYIVATSQPKTAGLSLGLIRPNVGGFVGMGGVVYNTSPNLQLVTDYIVGRENYSTFGVIAAASKTVSINLAYARPNDPNPGRNLAAGEYGSTNPKGFVFNVAYTFHVVSRNGQGGASGGTNRNPATP